MPETVTVAFGLNQEAFDATGAIDIFLDLDTKLFIDPHLLARSKTPELKDADHTFRSHFARLIQILAQCKREGDVFWRNADELLKFPEVRGLCFGYGARGTAGSGMGPELRGRLLETAKQIIEGGMQDPALFELVGLIEEDIGPDRISDMTARIIAPHLYAFTQRVFRELKVKGEMVHLGETSYELPLNNFSKRSVILCPREILRPLPQAFSWKDREVIRIHNEQTRKRVNRMIGETWRDATSRGKEPLREALLGEPLAFKDLVEQYKKKPQERYDFTADNDGFFVWVRTAQKFAANNPIKLKLSDKPDLEEVVKVVRTICESFKHAIEHKGLNVDLYKPGGKPRREDVSQRLFHVIADAYCKHSNLDLSPEVDGGRGPVDFKISSGYEGRVLAEIKLSTNKNLVHGYEVQVEEYKKAEGTHRCFFVVIDVGGNTWKKNLDAAIDRAKTLGKADLPEVVERNGERKKSASKA